MFKTDWLTVKGNKNETHLVLNLADVAKEGQIRRQQKQIPNRRE